MADTRTLTDMRNRIASELGRDDLSQTTAGNANIQNAIRDAIFFYQRKHFWTSEFIESIMLTANVRNYSFGLLAQPVVAIYKLELVNGSTIHELRGPLHYDTFLSREAEEPPIPSEPEEFCIYADSIYLTPVPDSSSYMLRVHYTGDIEFPASDSTSNFWTTQAEELIRNRAKYNLNMGVLRDPEAALMDKKLEEEALRTLEREVTEKTATGFIQPWTDWF